MVVPGTSEPDGSIVFRGELRVKPRIEAAAPVFLGPCTHGPPAKRFLYLSWSARTGPGREMFRRLKLQLESITWAQLDTSRANPGSCLTVTVSAIGRDGGPACATVPLLGEGWQVSMVNWEVTP